MCLRMVTSEYLESAAVSINKLKTLREATFENHDSIFIHCKMKNRISRSQIFNYFAVNSSIEKQFNDVKFHPELLNREIFEEITNISNYLPTSLVMEKDTKDKKVLIFGSELIPKEILISSVAKIHNLTFKRAENSLLFPKINKSKQIEIVHSQMIKNLPASLNRICLNTEERTIQKNKIAVLKRQLQTGNPSVNENNNLLTQINHCQEFLSRPDYNFIKSKNNLIISTEAYLKTILPKKELTKFENLPYMSKSALIAATCGISISWFKRIADGIPYYISDFENLYVEIKKGDKAFDNASPTAKIIHINQKMSDGTFAPVISFDIS